MYVSIGLDLSFTRTGISLVKRFEKVDGWVVNEMVSWKRFVTSPKESFVLRTLRISDWVNNIIYELYSLDQRPDVIVIEGPALNGINAALMNALDMFILTDIYGNFGDVEIFVVPPMLLRKYNGVTGKKKSLVVQKIKERLPNTKGICHDEADAAFLALLGSDYLLLKNKVKFDKIAEHANYVFYNEALNKKGSRKGLVYREGEFYFPKR